VKFPVRVLAWSSTVAVTLTGGVYAVMAYCLEPADPMDVTNHPWQPTVLHLHLLAAPLCLFGFGVLWNDHVWPKLRARGRARRRSGLLLLGVSGPMAASGYLLQTSVDDAWRSFWVVAHVATSLLWVAAFALHVMTPARAAARS
jgi:hypothetical protein